MHVIERTDDFTLVGADARRGKLTLFAAEGPREPGALVRVVLRVRDLDAGARAAPGDLEVARPRDGLATFEAPEGLGLGLVSVPDADLDYDIDHVVLRVPDPARSARAVRDARVRARRRAACRWATSGWCSSPATARAVERPLLNHIALLVDSGQEQLEEARAARARRRRGARRRQHVRRLRLGPDRIKLEYVEHKPGFSLV